MRLIIQKIGDKLYAYTETEAHHKKVETGRENRLDPKILGDDCDLDNMPSGHFVFRLK